MFGLGKKKVEGKPQALKQMELPAGMTPHMAVELLGKRLQAYMRDMKQFACANAVITSKEPSYDFDTKTIHPGDVIFDPDHCKNPRGQHSRFCDKCREEGLAKREPKVKQAPPARVNYSRKKRKMMNSKRHGTSQRRNK